MVQLNPVIPVLTPEGNGIAIVMYLFGPPGILYFDVRLNNGAITRYSSLQVAYSALAK